MLTLKHLKYSSMFRTLTTWLKIKTLLQYLELSMKNLNAYWRILSMTRLAFNLNHRLI